MYNVVLSVKSLFKLFGRCTNQLSILFSDTYVVHTYTYTMYIHMYVPTVFFTLEA